MYNLVHFQIRTFKWPLFFTMEIYLNNLLAEETIEEQCDPILNLCLKEHTPRLLLSLALLNLLSQFLSIRRNFPSRFSGKNDFT